MITTDQALKYLKIEDRLEADNIKNLINYASSYIKNYCNRDFKLEEKTEFYAGNNQLLLKLKSHPIVEIVELKIDDKVIPKTKYLTRNKSIFYKDYFPIRYREFFKFNIPNRIKLDLNVEVTYKSGFATIPDDLQLATLEIVNYLYHHQQGEAWIKSESIQNDNNLLKTENKNFNNFSPLVFEILNKYKI